MQHRSSQMKMQYTRILIFFPYHCNSSPSLSDESSGSTLYISSSSSFRLWPAINKGFSHLFKYRLLYSNRDYYIQINRTGNKFTHIFGRSLHYNFLSSMARGWGGNNPSQSLIYLLSQNIRGTKLPRFTDGGTKRLRALISELECPNTLPFNAILTEMHRLPYNTRAPQKTAKLGAVQTTHCCKKGPKQDLNQHLLHTKGVP